MIKFDRKFVLYSYSGSHGVLLFRSGKTHEYPTRVDISVRDVRAMEIRSWSDGLVIEQVGAEYLEGFQSNPSEMIEVGVEVYALSGPGWRGFVVGGPIFVSEDDRNFTDPSGLADA